MKITVALVLVAAVKRDVHSALLLSTTRGGHVEPPILIHSVRDWIA